MSQSFVYQFRVPPLENALVEFYRDRYKKSRAELMRAMVMKYIDSDKSFDPDAFQQFVSRKLARKIDDPDAKKELVRTAKDYAATRKKADATTQTMTRS